MKKILLFLVCLLFTTQIYAQIPSEEQELINNLEIAKQRTRESEIDYNKEVYQAQAPLFQYYWKTGNYAKAERIILEILQTIEIVLGRYDQSYAEFQAYLGQIQTYMGRYEDAKNTFLSMLDTYKHAKTIENPQNYVSNHALLAMFFSISGDYQQAEKYALENLQIFAQYKDINPIYKYSGIASLSTIYINTGQYKKAEKCIFEVLSLVPKNHIEYGKTLNNIGLLYFRMGDYQKSTDYFIQAYEAKKQTLPENHPLHGGSLCNIALLHTYAGDYETAEKTYFQALAIQEKNKENNPREYANTLINIGQLYTLTGDYVRSLEYNKKGVDALGNILGTDHLDYAAGYATRALLELSMGDYTSAIQTAQKAIAIQQKIDPKHPEIIAITIALGKAHLMNKDYDKAEVTLQEALKNTQTLLGTKHETYAEALYLLGLLYHKKDDATQAENYYLQSLNAYKNLHSDQHPKYVTALNGLGELYQTTHQYTKAKTCFEQAAQASKDLFVASTDYMSERQRSLFWETIRNRYESIYPNFAYDSFQKNPKVAGFAYNNELFIKGLLLHSSASIHNSIIKSGDSVLVQQWNDLKQMNVRILALQENDPTSSYIEELKQEAEALEKQLTTSSTIFRDNKNAWNITWESVRNSLQSNQVAIEFFISPDGYEEKNYCALLIRANSTHPILIPLCKESQLTAVLAQEPSQTYGYAHYGKTLHKLIWVPILAHIQQANTIYFSPTGQLHQLAIEYLPYDAQSTMQDHYALKRLSSTRELVFNTPTPSISNAVLYGGIQYDMDGEELLAESELYSNHLFASRSVQNNVNRAGVHYLPGTKKEVNYINTLLSENNIRSRLYTGGSGNEESFKSLDGEDNHILHVATHGFFWSDENAKSTDYYMQRMINPNQKTIPIDPLSRCGLLLAGANLSLSGHADELPQGVQDGILTAKEIALLDLSQTQIAVLSACETGKGEITGEGVFGLQRALKQAGVQSIIMSLWPVDDAATQLLMEHFYIHWIKEKMNKHEAFRKAQAIVKNKFGGHEYWAGFVLLD